MPKHQTGYEPRRDYSTFNTDMLTTFEEFAANGHAEYTFPTRQQAFSYRTRLYRTRLMLLRARDHAPDEETREQARDLYASAQYMYIEINEAAPGRWVMRVILDPITRIRSGDELPWKRVFQPQQRSTQEQADADDAFDKAWREAELRKLKGEQR